jgi:hypothetical protein
VNGWFNGNDPAELPWQFISLPDFFRLVARKVVVTGSFRVSPYYGALRLVR